MADIREELKKYIAEEFPTDDELDLETADLLEEEVIDSLGIFTLISFIEDKFGVSIDPAEINLANFQTIESITALVESKS